MKLTSFHLQPGLRVNDWELISGPTMRRATGRARRSWLCRCSCGREQEVWESNLLFGTSKRCRPCGARQRRRPKRTGMHPATVVGLLRHELQRIPEPGLEQVVALVAAERARRAAWATRGE